MEERPRYIVVLFSGNGIPILRVNVNVDLSSAQMHVRFPILYIQASHWLIFLLGNYTQSVHPTYTNNVPRKPICSESEKTRIRATWAMWLIVP